jgi:hypothetical protein
LDQGDRWKHALKLPQRLRLTRHPSHQGPLVCRHDRSCGRAQSLERKTRRVALRLVVGRGEQECSDRDMGLEASARGTN